MGSCGLCSLTAQQPLMHFIPQPASQVVPDLAHLPDAELAALATALWPPHARELPTKAKAGRRGPPQPRRRALQGRRRACTGTQPRHWLQLLHTIPTFTMCMPAITDLTGGH